MKKWITYSILGVVAALSFLSCKKDTPTIINMGYNYFPNSPKHWIIYNVDSMYYYAFKWDTAIYQVKEVIDSFYNNNLGEPTQVIIRYKKPNSSSSWVYQKTWTANLSNTEALKKEDGITYVKLTFPVKLDASWNGNAFNTLQEWDYSYTSVDAPATVNITHFDSTATVLQRNQQDLLTNQFYEEIYARNTGCVQRIITNLVAPGFIGFDPYAGKDSLWVPSDYIYLIQNNRLDQSQSFIYTEIYNSSGN